MKVLIAIDSQFAEHAVRDCGHARFPYAEYMTMQRNIPDRDVIEAYATLIEWAPDGTQSNDDAASSLKRRSDFLEYSGYRVVRCPAKRTPNGGFKHSDDPRLQVTTLVAALKLRPDFVSLVAADGDFAPMVEALRAEGIRTEVVATATTLASDLKRAAYTTVHLDEVIERITEEE